MTKELCIYNMNAEQLIKNKDALLMDLSHARLEFKRKEADLLLNTDFKELKLTNEKMRNAYITEQVFSLKTSIEAYENSLTIINDLLRLRLIEMQEVKTE